MAVYWALKHVSEKDWSALGFVIKKQQLGRVMTIHRVRDVDNHFPVYILIRIILVFNILQLTELHPKMNRIIKKHFIYVYQGVTDLIISYDTQNEDILYLSLAKLS